MTGFHLGQPTNRFLESLAAEVACEVEQGIEVLRKGGVVAYPTDTVYGLGAGLSDDAAVQRVINAKGRAESMGMPLLLSRADMLAPIVREVHPEARALIERFWPGALTLVMTKSAAVSDLVSGGRSSVAVRVPNHPVPRALSEGVGGPIIGTSANRTGAVPASSAVQVREQLNGAVDLVIDGLPSLGVQSTILDLTGPAPRVLRTGAVSREEIQTVCPGVQ